MLNTLPNHYFMMFCSIELMGTLYWVLCSSPTHGDGKYQQQLVHMKSDNLYCPHSKNLRSGFSLSLFGFVYFNVTIDNIFLQPVPVSHNKLQWSKHVTGKSTYQFFLYLSTATHCIPSVTYQSKMGVIMLYMNRTSLKCFVCVEIGIITLFFIQRSIWSDTLNPSSLMLGSRDGRYCVCVVLMFTQSVVRGPCCVLQYLALVSQDFGHKSSQSNPI